MKQDQIVDILYDGQVVFFFYSSTETESKMVSDKAKKRVTSMSFNKHLGDRKAWCFHIYYTG